MPRRTEPPPNPAPEAARSTPAGPIARRTLARALATIAVTAAAALGAPSAALAARATVSIDNEAQHYELRFAAAPGEANRVTAWLAAGRAVMVRDEGAPVTAGPGCEPVDDHTARCDGSPQGWWSGVFALGDRSDLAWFVDVERRCLEGEDEEEEGNDACAWGDAEVYGGSGDDAVVASNEAVWGGDGNDHVLGGAYGRVNGGRGADTLVGQHVKGGPGADRLTAIDEGGVLDGQAGNDTLTGGSDWDLLIGGPGADRFYARDGQVDQVRGGSGYDRARVDRRLDLTSSIARFF